MRATTVLSISLLSLFLAGCATPFPRPSEEPLAFEDGRSGEELFAESMAAHGGDVRDAVGDLNVSVSGKWGGVIKKVQPLVTDFKYRVDSEERFMPGEGFYAARWTGPAGTKLVLRDEDGVRVFYNGEESSDGDVLDSSALTSDAFQLFHFGPSFLKRSGAEPVRLADFKEKGKSYYRLYFELEPGFGKSARDEVVVLIDKETRLMYRVWITLEGFRTTKGASADVTFLEYDEIAGLQLPVRFVERVRAPISVHAHTWQTLGWDVDRGYEKDEVDAWDWSEVLRAESAKR